MIQQGLWKKTKYQNMIIDENPTTKFHFILIVQFESEVKRVGAT